VLQSHPNPSIYVDLPPALVWIILSEGFGKWILGFVYGATHANPYSHLKPGPIMRDDGIHAAVVHTAAAPPVAVYHHVQLRQAPRPETLAVGTGSTGDPLHVSWRDIAQCTHLQSERGSIGCCIRHVKGSDKDSTYSMANVFGSC
jgi:hypothetical protein